MVLMPDYDPVVTKVTVGDNAINSYVIVDPVTAKGVIVDAPSDPSAVFEQTHGIEIESILITHTHLEQMEGLDWLREITGATVWVNAIDANVFNYFTPVNSIRPENPFHAGVVIPCGNMEIKVIHTPGHTPGSSCYVIGRHLFSGHAVFDHSKQDLTPENLDQSIQSVVHNLFVLPDDIIVHTSNGADSTMLDIRSMYRSFSGH